MKTSILLAILLLLTLPSFAKDIDKSPEHLESTIMNMKSGTKTTGGWFMNLSQASQIWLITGFIDKTKEDNVTIKRSPLFYLKELYTEYDASPSQLQYPVGTVIKGKTEQGVFKEMLGDGWQEMYNKLPEIRGKIKEAGAW